MEQPTNRIRGSHEECYNFSGEERFCVFKEKIQNNSLTDILFKGTVLDFEIMNVRLGTKHNLSLGDLHEKLFKRAWDFLEELY
ncbi:MAG: hypothetical protein PVF58_19515 [Candidatus Methanofastidiosia archaeon]